MIIFKTITREICTTESLCLVFTTSQALTLKPMCLLNALMPTVFIDGVVTGSDGASGECRDLHDRVIMSGLHYVPGPDTCTLCEVMVRQENVGICTTESLCLVFTTSQGLTLVPCVSVECTYANSIYRWGGYRK
ncbi:hypothetical protein J6590_003749 [Homalodisca vitripennis]|nr:hypothetical protein J6590_003749 [Homalodisca vitripennis]